MQDWIAATGVLIGCSFMLLGSIGIVRMPDLYTRLQTSTKAATLGIALVFLAVAVVFGSEAVVARAALGTVFLLLTTPVAAHMIGRAAYFDGTPMYGGTHINEIEGRYDPGTHELQAPNTSELKTTDRSVLPQ